MFKSPVAKDITSIVLYGAGVASVSMIVWTAGPFIAFGDYRPLENYIVREIVIILLVALVASIGGLSFWRRRKHAAALEQGLVAEEAQDDSETLGERMKSAIATLKASSGGRSDFLYDLPWYVLVGPPGAGKTTALVNSGLRFPLSGGATPAAIAGAGGTRYCDWWFTEDAVLIDTAGRYTTQDSDATLDKKSWLAFLDLLKTNRPKQPINGVIIAISLHDLLTLPPEQVAEHAGAIRARLVDIHDQLKVDFPVYALFTKTDLISGFVEFFADLDEQARRQVWGATFQTADKKKNLVGQTPVEFDALIARLNERMPDRLQDEPAPAPRVALFGFPAQMASLKGLVHDFLNAIFEPTRYHANAALRGFYFTSGAQEGTPIDRLIMALVRNFGAREVRAPALSGLGKSYFLNDLIQKVIIGEAAWVSTNVAAVRRQLIVKAATIGVAAAVALGALGVWWMSYRNNLALVSALRNVDIEYIVSAGEKRHEDVVGDRDFDKIEPLLRKLRSMPAGFLEGDVAPPLRERFGLSQRARLHSSAVEAYRAGLERLLRPRLLYRLEEALDAHRDDPSALYDALKVYMMLGGSHALDRDFVLSWERQDWRDNLYPGAGQDSGRTALEDHLRAMLVLDDGRPPLVELSGVAIENAQSILARLSVAQRAYQLLKSQARDIPDWNAQTAGGLDADRVFETTTGADLATVRTPGFFTYQGFQTGLLDRLGGIADKVRADKWVLGRFGEEADVAAQFDTLPVDVYQLYAKDFVAAWKTALAELQLRRLTADKPRYLTLAALAAPSSPLRVLLESIRDETALTREPPKPKAGAGGKDQTPRPPILLNEASIGPPGSTIEAQFRPFAAWVEGSPPGRPIDQLLGKLNEIKDNLILSASVPAQAAQANAALEAQLQTLRAQGARLPPPFDAMISRAANAFATEVNDSVLGQLTRALGNQVAGPCQQLVPGRYPFDRGARREIALADFGRLFGVGGVFDRFFQSNLAKYVNQSQSTWTWRRDDALASTFSPTTLLEFQRADQIKNVFFSTGGALPNVNIQVFPPVLSGAGATAKFEVNGASVTSQAGASVASGAIQWPGAAAGGRAALTLSYDPNAAASSVPTAAVSPTPAAQAGVSAVLERTGAWSLFRLFDAAGARQHGDRMSASFLLGGRELQYQFAFGTSANPYLLPALREFRCPSGL